MYDTSPAASVSTHTHTHSRSAGLSLYFNTALSSHVLIPVYVFKYHPVAYSLSVIPSIPNSEGHSQPLNLADSAGKFPFHADILILGGHKRTTTKNTTSLLFKPLPLLTDKKKLACKTAQITDGMFLATMCLNLITVKCWDRVKKDRVGILCIA